MNSLEEKLNERVFALEKMLNDQVKALMEALLVRWTFFFWVGLLSSQIAILFAFFK